MPRGWERRVSVREALETLPRSFAQGFKGEIEPLRQVLRGASSLVTVGSGGSHTVAEFAARLIEDHFHILAKTSTPHDYVLAAPLPLGVLLVSARGVNPDIQMALHTAILRGAKPLVAISAAVGSPLDRRVLEYPDGVAVAIPDLWLPGTREGFLAIHSLMAMVALLLRAADCFGTDRSSLPSQWCEDLIRKARTELDQEQELVRLVSTKRRVVILGSGWAWPAAVDFESKCVEGGLGCFELSEAKNFTHGRFVNSLRSSDETGIVFLATEAERPLLDLFRAQWSDHWPILPVRSAGRGAEAGCELLVRSMLLFESIVHNRAINVDRPAVPGAARTLFHASGLYPPIEKLSTVQARVDLILDLKRRALNMTSVSELARMVPRPIVEACYTQALVTRYNGLAVDYDGTLIPLEEPDARLAEELVHALTELIVLGIPIAVITGRGRSLIRAMRTALPSSLHELVDCYLYNGAVLWTLSHEHPTWVRELPQQQLIYKHLEGLTDRRDMVREIETASLGCQVTVHLVSPTMAAPVMKDVASLLGNFESLLAVRTSGRSVDITARSVSKVGALDEFCSRRAGGGVRRTPLVVADQGDEEGNDHDILQTPGAFSVDRLHWNPRSCFPVLRNKGQLMVLRGPEATLWLLEHARRDAMGFQLE